MLSFNPLRFQGSQTLLALTIIALNALEAEAQTSTSSSRGARIAGGAIAGIVIGKRCNRLVHTPVSLSNS